MNRSYRALLVGAIASVALVASSFGAAAGAATAATPASPGYWLATPQGAAFPFGGASTLFGPASTIFGLHGPIVGIVATPRRDGYWMVASDGGVFAFGRAAFYGSLGNRPLNAPIVAMASTPDGRGYWLVGGDGGVFAFGDAVFAGSSVGHLPLATVLGNVVHATVVGIVAAPDGRGYALVTEAGGVLPFGSGSTFFSPRTSIPNLLLPIVGVAKAPVGFWMLALDGGVFAFDGAPFWGSAGLVIHNFGFVGMAATSDGRGYWL
ncbi:MAG TPA: hypothetical protein VIK61_19795, partial [Acidimicrobiia bacterium]